MYHGPKLPQMVQLPVDDSAPQQPAHHDDDLSAVTVPADAGAPAAAQPDATRKRKLSEAAMEAFGHYADGEAEQQTGRPRKRTKYEPGQHGGRKHEQKRLTSEFDFKVSGTTHESEHTVGFAPINNGTGLERGSGGRARQLENRAPAYQEEKHQHRAHIGTGTRSRADESGMNSHDYRAGQRAFLEASDVSSAVQLNQLGYAFQEGFQNDDSPEAKASDDSFQRMAAHLRGLTYAQGARDVTVPIDDKQRIEMQLSRQTARSGKWPTQQINEFSDMLEKKKPDE